VRLFDSSEAGFTSGWNVDILVRFGDESGNRADKNVCDPKDRRCAQERVQMAFIPDTIEGNPRLPFTRRVGIGRGAGC
jgi:hypothetical protein